MTSLRIRYLILGLCGIAIIGTSAEGYAQNLVPNPSFETYLYCPTTISQIAWAEPWVSPTAATPDYYHACSSSIAVDVPVNFGGAGYQLALAGEAYAGIYLRSVNEYREYIQIPLTQTLELGKCYYVGFFMNVLNQWCGVSEVGIYLSAEPPTSQGQTQLQVQPQIEANGGFYGDTLLWSEISGFYPALGGERYITIGNFKTNAETPIDPDCANMSTTAYYYIDSVYVIEAGPSEELELELGPPVVTCLPHEIDGESGDVTYLWSDGSTGHTLTVTSSGLYFLTITDDCAIGVDSVEVTFYNAPPVALDPGFVTLCEGESYTITLDPDAGQYEWSDGSTSNEYTITAPGTYAVTLDDGCDLTSDEVMIDVLLFPEPVFLGNDTILCEGDYIEIDLEPGMNMVTWQDGSTWPDYTISTPGTYSVTISNACGETSDDIEVTGLQVPAIDLGPDTIGWCEGEVIQYNFDPALGDFLWSDDSDNPYFTIQTSGLYGVTVYSVCGIAQDEVVVYETAEPVTGLAESLELCDSAFPYTLAIQEASPIDVVMWSTGETDPQISVSGPGIYSVTISNECYTVADSVIIGIVPIPSPDLPDTALLCPGGTIELDAGISMADFEWQDGSTAPTFVATIPGVYTVMISTECGTVFDTTEVVSYPDLIGPDLGPDQFLCDGAQIILFANSPNGSFQWNDLSSADSLLVSQPGTYSVTVQDQCTSVSDTILITLSQMPPQLDLPSAVSLCQGASLLIESGIAGVNYLWSDGTTNTSLLVQVPGSYSLTVTNSCGSDSDTVAVMDGGTLPFIELGADILLCPGETHLVSPNIQNADQWIWSDGSSDSTFLTSTVGLVTIEATNECGSISDTVMVSLLSGFPAFSLGEDTSLCDFQTMDLSVSIPGVSITWFDGSHGSQVTITGAGTYTVSVENECEVALDTLIVFALPEIPALNLGMDQLLCPGELLTLSPGIPGVQYLWQDGTTGSSFSTTQPGEIILSISNTCGTSADTLLVVESTEGPQLNLGPDVQACMGDTVIIQAGTAGVAYTWQDGSTQSFFQVTTDATLMLHIANACGADADTLAVHFISPPDPDLGPDTLLCDEAQLNLVASADPNTSVIWQDGSHAPNFTVTTSGVYSVQQSNICGEVTDSIVVSYQYTPLPFSLGPDVMLCPGESIELQAPVTTDQLLWQDGSTISTMIASEQQTYELTVYNACGSTQDQMEVTIDEAVPIVALEPHEICPGDVVVLDVSQSFAAQYSWSTGSAEPSIAVHQPGEYMVTVMTPCFTISDQVSVLADEHCIEEGDYYVPNVFSPNGDAVNDVFSLHFNERIIVHSVATNIFDRWGNLVFTSTQYPFTWNGTFHEKPLNPGVYVYMFVLNYSIDGRDVTERVTGNLTLVR